MYDSYVILVDENDNPLGKMEKIKAHTEARLHRAISVFIINSKGEWLLQRRAQDKYHSSGLWTNTCCTHPFPGESNADAARRRLMEEMGIDCELTEIFSFIYQEKLDNEMTEYEYDHVFTGISDHVPVINSVEVGDWKCVSFEELESDMIENQAAYTVWFREVFRQVDLHIKNLKRA